MSSSLSASLNILPTIIALFVLSLRSKNSFTVCIQALKEIGVLQIFSPNLFSHIFLRVSFEEQKFYILIKSLSSAAA